MSDRCEDIGLELRDISNQISALMLLVEPTHTDPDGEGTPTQELIMSVADGISFHLLRIARELESLQG